MNAKSLYYKELFIILSGSPPTSLLDIDAIRDYFTILWGYNDVKKMEELKEQGINKIDNDMRARATETRKKVDRELRENRN
jgi:hypothetical protein